MTGGATQRICAIHQPNFFPWLGYFDKIARADVFVFLDDVIYPRSGSGMGTWGNRVRIAINGQARWIGCPVERYSSTRLFREVTIREDGHWRDKLLRTLECTYRRCSGYPDAMQVLEPLLRDPTCSLADFNIHAVRTLTDCLGLSTRFVRQSELGVSGSSTELLVALTRAVSADVYLCGGGAAGYQDDTLFAPAGVRLLYQNFTPTPYADPFIPGQSVIDYLMRTVRRDWPSYWTRPGRIAREGTERDGDRGRG